jgi:hypothetical protein
MILTSLGGHEIDHNFDSNVIDLFKGNTLVIKFRTKAISSQGIGVEHRVYVLLTRTYQSG